MSSGISTTKDQAGHGYPFVSFGTVFNNYFLPEQLPDLMDTSEKEQDIYSIKEGDILITRTSETIDELAMSCVATKNYPKATYSGFTKRLRPKTTGIAYHKYLAFYLRGYLFRKAVTNNAFMTLRASFNEDIFSFLNLYLPEYQEQVKIGDMHYNMEQKIRLNQKICSELETMAKTLYDYWFVQFDFPNEEGKPYKSSGGAMVWNEELKREIPQGWSNMSIGDYAPCKSGYAFKSKDFGGKGLPVIKIGNIQENYTLDMTDSQCIGLFNKTLFLAKRYDLVIAMTGATIGKFAISQSNYWVNQRVGRFDLGDRPLLRLGFLFNSLKQEYFREQVSQIACGCAQPNISAEQIDSISILKPNDVILNQFNKLCEPLLELQSENYLQIEELTKQRNELLPLLMSGQVSVNSDLSVYKKRRGKVPSSILNDVSDI